MKKDLYILKKIELENNKVKLIDLIKLENIKSWINFVKLLEISQSNKELKNMLSF